MKYTVLFFLLFLAGCTNSLATDIWSEEELQHHSQNPNAVHFVPPQLEDELIVIRQAKPIYPPEAMRAGLEGYVILEYDIHADGSVTDFNIIKASSSTIFSAAAIDAIRASEYKVILSDTDKLPIKRKTLIRFKLSNTPENQNCENTDSLIDLGPETCNSL